MFALTPLFRHVLERSRNPGFGARRTPDGRAVRFFLSGLKRQRRGLPPAEVGSLPFMKGEPALELRLFIDVWIKSCDSLPDGADAVKDLQGEVSCRRRLGDLSLGLDPGKIPMRPGAADLFVGIPDAVQADPVQGAQRGEAGFVERAGGATAGRGFFGGSPYIVAGSRLP